LTATSNACSLGSNPGGAFWKMIWYHIGLARARDR
jgi:hypothetical protein